MALYDPLNSSQGSQQHLDTLAHLPGFLREHVRSLQPINNDSMPNICNFGSALLPFRFPSSSPLPRAPISFPSPSPSPAPPQPSFVSGSQASQTSQYQASQASQTSQYQASQASQTSQYQASQASSRSKSVRSDTSKNGHEHWDPAGIDVLITAVHGNNPWKHRNNKQKGEAWLKVLEEVNYIAHEQGREERLLLGIKAKWNGISKARKHQVVGK